MKRRDLFKLAGGAAAAAVVGKAFGDHNDVKPATAEVLNDDISYDPKTGVIRVRKRYPARVWLYDVKNDAWSQVE